MINYHNPVTIAQEFGACPFCRTSGTSSPLTGWPPQRWSREILAPREWNIYVGLRWRVLLG